MWKRVVFVLAALLMGIGALPSSVSAANVVSKVKAAPGDRVVSVSWSKASMTGHAVAGYSLQGRAKGAATWSAKSLSAATSTFTWTGLKNGTTYEFRVVARFVGTTTTLASVAVAGVPRTVWTAVSAGGIDTCGINSFKEVWCWGDDQHGQLGHGVAGPNTSKPAKIALPAPATAVSVGAWHACALLTDATVACWGDNSQAQLGRGTSTGTFGAGRVPGLSGIRSITIGSYHTCASSAATTWCWGQNSFGQIGAPASGVPTASPLQVPATADGRLVVADAGSANTCGLTAVGSAWCWGYGGNGRNGNGSTSDFPTPQRVAGLLGGVSVPAISATHACVLAYGQIGCWGSGQLGELAIASLPASVTMPAVPDIAVPSMSVVDTGGGYTCGIATTGKVWCFGFNGFGQQGMLDTNITERPHPVVLPATFSATRLSVGDDHACTIDTSGGMWCWGRNISGESGAASLFTETVVPLAITRSV